MITDIKNGKNSFNNLIIVGTIRDWHTENQIKKIVINNNFDV